MCGECRCCVDHNGVRNLEDQDCCRHRLDVPVDTVLLEQVRRLHRQVMHSRMTRSEALGQGQRAFAARTHTRLAKRDPSCRRCSSAPRLVGGASAEYPTKVHQSPRLGNRSCVQARCIPIRTLYRCVAAPPHYACPPIILPQLPSSGPSKFAPSPLNHPTISCGASVHRTLANCGLTVAELVRASRPRRERWSNACTPSVFECCR